MSRRMAQLMLEHGDAALAALTLHAEFKAKHEARVATSKKPTVSSPKAPAKPVTKMPEPTPAQAREAEAKLNALLAKADAGNHLNSIARRGTNMKTISKEQAQSAWKKALKREGQSDVAPSGSAPTATATGGRSKLSADQIKACWKKAVAQ